MSPRLRTLSGAQVVRILERFGFAVERQRGSHVKMVRLQAGRRQVLTVPDHKQLAAGTAHTLYRQACAFIPEEELREHFYAT